MGNLAISGSKAWIGLRLTAARASERHRGGGNERRIRSKPSRPADPGSVSILGRYFLKKMTLAWNNVGIATF
jgi:hypothetical protein